VALRGEEGAIEGVKLREGEDGAEYVVLGTEEDRVNEGWRLIDGEADDLLPVLRGLGAALARCMPPERFIIGAWLCRDAACAGEAQRL